MFRAYFNPSFTTSRSPLSPTSLHCILRVKCLRSVEMRNCTYHTYSNVSTNIQPTFFHFTFTHTQAFLVFSLESRKVGFLFLPVFFNSLYAARWLERIQWLHLKRRGQGTCISPCNYTQSLNLYSKCIIQYTRFLCLV